MPGKLRDDLQPTLWERDGDRCRDCGAAVGANLVTPLFSLSCNQRDYAPTPSSYEPRRRIACRSS